jgi:PAS domain S-box-containing protein
MPTTAGEAHRVRLKRIRDVSQALAQAVDVDSLFATLHGELNTVLNADTLLLALYDEVSGTIEVVRQADYGTQLPGGTFPIGHGVTSEVIRTRTPRLIRQWSSEAPPVQVQYVSSTPGLPESSMTVPLVSGAQVVGVLAVHSYAPDAFDADDLLVLEAIAAPLAGAISSLQRSEHLNLQLRDRVSELQAVLGTMADALLRVDIEGRVVSLNRAARELLTVDDASLVLGQPLDHPAWGQWPLGAREITDTLAPMIAALQRGETPPEAEVRLQRQHRRILSFSGTPLTRADGKVTGGVIVVRDVTARHEIEELKDEMLSVASHDLRTPVTVIRSQAQLMRRAIRTGAFSLEDVNDGLGSIVEETQRLAKLLELLLDLSRIEAGRFEIDPRPVDLGKLASTVVSEVQSTTDRHQMKVQVSGSVVGNWDEARLQQVLTNLLTNAVKYSPNGGPIEVHVRGGEDEVTTSVNDEGIGLTHGEAQHVFERFFRARSTRRLEGSGLGLYICQSILAAHGGRIWVESGGSGRGSSFCFTLPRG